MEHDCYVWHFVMILFFFAVWKKKQKNKVELDRKQIFSFSAYSFSVRTL